MEYDDAVYTVVVVLRAENGQLVADVDVTVDGNSYSSTNLVFTNIYFANHHVPDTGDNTGLMTWESIALIAGGLLIVLLMMKKKANKE